MPDKEALRNEAAIADLNSKLSEVNQSYEDIQAELLRAKREIKLLKRSAAEERKKYAVAILQKDKDLEQARLEHRELADLREVVFSKMIRPRPPILGRTLRLLLCRTRPKNGR